LDDGQVRFRYRNYRDTQPRSRTMTLPATEFIRRFLLHVLPAGFHRIRCYGLFGNRHRHAQLARCRQLLAAVPPDTRTPTTAPPPPRPGSRTLASGVPVACSTVRAIASPTPAAIQSP
jgi:hypothetical protein